MSTVNSISIAQYGLADVQEALVLIDDVCKIPQKTQAARRATLANAARQALALITGHGITDDLADITVTLLHDIEKLLANGAIPGGKTIEAPADAYVRLLAAAEKALDITSSDPVDRARVLLDLAREHQTRPAPAPVAGTEGTES